MTNTTEKANQKIYVTGATGWVGRTFLHELQSTIPSSEFNQRVIAFGSKTNLIKSTNYRQEHAISIPIKPLSSLRHQTKGQDIMLFHSAFLTKDRISQYGISKFIRINEEITNTVVNFIKQCKNSRVIHISSGAAAIAERKDDKKKNASDLYGNLKLSEERQLSTITNTQTLRIYALTGRFIRNPEIFAIGDLLMKALKKEPLILDSAYPVIRSYVNASDVANFAIKWLHDSENPTLAIGASSHITTLARLAETIAKQYYLAEPIMKPLISTPNSYSCSPIVFEKKLNGYGINSMSLVEQIRDTANGLRERYF